MSGASVFEQQMAGLVFVGVFLSLLLWFTFRRLRKLPARDNFRTIEAFQRLGQSLGLAVESGQRLHVSLGRGTLAGLQAASALVGLSVLQRVARAASISDRPPTATSGDGVVGILSQTALASASRSAGAAQTIELSSAQVTGLTPMSYAAGTLPEIYDRHVSANILMGHFGPEAVLITDAAERNGSSVLAGSDSLTGQAVLAASAGDALLGEELYAGGAYLNAGPMHAASLQTQDWMRWIIVGIILIGVVLKLAGIL